MSFLSLATTSDLKALKTMLQDDLTTALSNINTTITTEHAAVQKFIADVTALISTQGNPALVSGVEAAIAALNATAANVTADTTAIATADGSIPNASVSTSTAAPVSGTGSTSTSGSTSSAS